MRKIKIDLEGTLLNVIPRYARMQLLSDVDPGKVCVTMSKVTPQVSKLFEVNPKFFGLTSTTRTSHSALEGYVVRDFQGKEYNFRIQYKLKPNKNNVVIESITSLD